MEIESSNTSLLSRSSMMVRVVRAVSPTMFWVHLLHTMTQFTEMLEDLNEYMNRRKNKLLYLATIKEGIQLAVETKKGWQRGVVIRLNEDQTVQIALRDWGHLIRCPRNDLYILEDQFKRMGWQAIPCGLAYAGPTTRGDMWSRKTMALTKILAEQQEGEFRIVKPVHGESAFVKLQIQTPGNDYMQDLLGLLCQLGHAQKLETVATIVSPSINNY
nr:PREDICTED: tudor and KH domain-containing protein-like [Linepithema humile]